MSIAALPFATYLLLLEFAVGTQVVLLVPQFRGQVSPGFLKMGALMAWCGAGLALWVTAGLPSGGEIGGYPLDGRFIEPMRAATMTFFALTFPVNWFLWREDAPRGRVTGIMASVAALVALGLAAAVIRLPTWGYAGTLLALLAGAASLGTVSLGMTLGHWYLVTPRLPEKPLNDLTLLMLIVVGLQIVLVAVNVALPVRILPSGPDVPDVSLGANIWFWLRIGVGLIFPLALAFMAWQSSMVRAMMSATGLLYIAMGAVLAGEVLARALMFTTAKPL